MFMVFAVLVAGIMEARSGRVRGQFGDFRRASGGAVRFACAASSSGHVATASDIQASAAEYAAPLDPSNLTVTVKWLPDNLPGSSVQVTVAYAIRPAVLPLTSHTLTLQSTARERIAQ